MKKKIFKSLMTISMAITLLFNLTGCGNKNEEGSNTSETNTNNITAENYGDKVNYSITTNGIELNDWRLFLVENDTAYIIYGDMLKDKNALPTLSAGYVTQEKNGKISPLQERGYMLRELANTERWSYLLTEDLKDKGATAVGGLSLQQFVSSYNQKYTIDRFVIETGEQNEDGYTGYDVKIGYANGDTITGNLMHSKEGYEDALLGRNAEQKAGTLYFPDADSAFSTYWLITPGTKKGSILMISQGDVSHGGYNYVRPVISISTNHLNHNSDGSWNIN